MNWTKTPSVFRGISGPNMKIVSSPHIHFCAKPFRCIALYTGHSPTLHLRPEFLSLKTNWFVNQKSFSYLDIYIHIDRFQ